MSLTEFPNSLEAACPTNSNLRTLLDESLRPDNFSYLLLRGHVYDIINTESTNLSNRRQHAISTRQHHVSTLQVARAVLRTDPADLLTTATDQHRQRCLEAWNIKLQKAQPQSAEPMDLLNDHVRSGRPGRRHDPFHMGGLGGMGGRGFPGAGRGFRFGDDEDYDYGFGGLGPYEDPRERARQEQETQLLREYEFLELPENPALDTPLPEDPRIDEHIQKQAEAAVDGQVKKAKDHEEKLPGMIREIESNIREIDQRIEIINQAISRLQDIARSWIGLPDSLSELYRPSTAVRDLVRRSHERLVAHPAATFLRTILPEPEVPTAAVNAVRRAAAAAAAADPSDATVFWTMRALIRDLLNLPSFVVHMESFTSEHAGGMVAALAGQSSNDDLVRLVACCEILAHRTTMAPQLAVKIAAKLVNAAFNRSVDQIDDSVRYVEAISDFAIHHGCTGPDNSLTSEDYFTYILESLNEVASSGSLRFYSSAHALLQLAEYVRDAEAISPHIDYACKLLLGFFPRMAQQLLSNIGSESRSNQSIDTMLKVVEAHLLVASKPSIQYSESGRIWEESAISLFSGLTEVLYKFVPDTIKALIDRYTPAKLNTVTVHGTAELVDSIAKMLTENKIELIQKAYSPVFAQKDNVSEIESLTILDRILRINGCSYAHQIISHHRLLTLIPCTITIHTVIKEVLSPRSQWLTSNISALLQDREQHDLRVRRLVAGDAFTRFIDDCSTDYERLNRIQRRAETLVKLLPTTDAPLLVQLRQTISTSPFVSSRSLSPNSKSINSELAILFDDRAGRCFDSVVFGDVCAAAASRGISAANLRSFLHEACMQIVEPVKTVANRPTEENLLDLIRICGISTEDAFLQSSFFYDTVTETYSTSKCSYAAVSPFFVYLNEDAAPLHTALQAVTAFRLKLAISRAQQAIDAEFAEHTNVTSVIATFVDDAQAIISASHLSINNFVNYFRSIDYMVVENVMCACMLCISVTRELFDLFFITIGKRSAVSSITLNSVSSGSNASTTGMDRVIGMLDIVYPAFEPFRPYLEAVVNNQFNNNDRIFEHCVDNAVADYLHSHAGRTTDNYSTFGMITRLRPYFTTIKNSVEMVKDRDQFARSLVSDIGKVLLGQHHTLMLRPRVDVYPERFTTISPAGFNIGDVTPELATLSLHMDGENTMKHELMRLEEIISRLESLADSDTFKEYAQAYAQLVKLLRHTLEHFNEAVKLGHPFTVELAAEFMRLSDTSTLTCAPIDHYEHVVGCLERLIRDWKTTSEQRMNSAFIPSHLIPVVEREIESIAGTTYGCLHTQYPAVFSYLAHIPYNYVSSDNSSTFMEQFEQFIHECAVRACDNHTTVADDSTMMFHEYAVKSSRALSILDSFFELVSLQNFNTFAASANQDAVFSPMTNNLADKIITNKLTPGFQPDYTTVYSISLPSRVYLGAFLSLVQIWYNGLPAVSPASVFTCTTATRPSFFNHFLATMQSATPHDLVQQSPFVIVDPCALAAEQMDVLCSFVDNVAGGRNVVKVSRPVIIVDFYDDELPLFIGAADQIGQRMAMRSRLFDMYVKTKLASFLPAMDLRIVADPSSDSNSTFITGQRLLKFGEEVQNVRYGGRLSVQRSDMPRNGKTHRALRELFETHDTNFNININRVRDHEVVLMTVAGLGDPVSTCVGMTRSLMASALPRIKGVLFQPQSEFGMQAVNSLVMMQLLFTCGGIAQDSTFTLPFDARYIVEMRSCAPIKVSQIPPTVSSVLPITNEDRTNTIWRDVSKITPDAIYAKAFNATISRDNNTTTTVLHGASVNSHWGVTATAINYVVNDVIHIADPSPQYFYDCCRFVLDRSLFAKISQNLPDYVTTDEATYYPPSDFESQRHLLSIGTMERFSQLVAAQAGPLMFQPTPPDSGSVWSIIIAARNAVGMSSSRIEQHICNQEMLSRAADAINILANNANVPHNLVADANSDGNANQDDFDDDVDTSADNRDTSQFTNPSFWQIIHDYEGVNTLIIYNDLSKVPNSIRQQFALHNDTLIKDRGFRSQSHDSLFTNYICPVLLPKDHRYRTGGWQQFIQANPHLSSFKLTPDNTIKIINIYLSFIAGQPMLLVGETGCGKTAVIEFLSALAGLKMVHVHCHAGITVGEIVGKIKEAIADADAFGLTNHEVMHARRCVSMPESIIFFDEINASGTIDFISRIFTDRMYNGEYIPHNVAICGAVNPYRARRGVEEETYMHEDLNTQLVAEDGMVLNISSQNVAYKVLPISESLLDFARNYGANDRDAVKAYARSISAKQFGDSILAQFGIPKRDETLASPFMAMSASLGGDAEAISRAAADCNASVQQFEMLSSLLGAARKEFSQLIVDAHFFVLQKSHSSAAVCLRDIARVTSLADYFLRFQTSYDAATDTYTGFSRFELPPANANVNVLAASKCTQTIIKAIFLSIYFTYALRLPDKAALDQWMVRFGRTFITTYKALDIRANIQRMALLKCGCAMFGGLNRDTPTKQDILTAVKSVWMQQATAYFRFANSILVSDDVTDERREIIELPMLVENVFVTAVSYANRIPLITIGNPGASKTLATNTVIDALNGITREHSDNIYSHFPKLLHQFYQGSETTTSAALSAVFKHVAEFYEGTQLVRGLNIPTLFFDEIGLAEHSINNPLKVLHAHLERDVYHITDNLSLNSSLPLDADGRIIRDDAGYLGYVSLRRQRLPYSFIGVSNDVIDPAKLSRVQVLRCAPPDDEVIMKILMHSIKPGSDSPEFFRRLARFVKFMLYGKVPDNHTAPINYSEFSKFVGMRDVYHFARLVSKKGSDTTREALYWISMRCFSPLNAEYQDRLARYCVEVTFGRPFTAPMSAEIQQRVGDSLDDTKGRHILLVVSGCSPIIMAKMIVNRIPIPPEKGLQFDYIRASCFEHDIDDVEYSYRTLSSVASSMARGAITVIEDIGPLWSSLYSMLNQAYITTGDNQQSARIAYSITDQPLQPVRKPFRVIGCITEEAWAHAAPAFVNRFERIFVSIDDVYMPQANDTAVETRSQAIWSCCGRNILGINSERDFNVLRKLVDISNVSAFDDVVANLLPAGLALREEVTTATDDAPKFDFDHPNENLTQTLEHLALEGGLAVSSERPYLIVVDNTAPVSDALFDRSPGLYQIRADRFDTTVRLQNMFARMPADTTNVIIDLRHNAKIGQAVFEHATDFMSNRPADAPVISVYIVLFTNTTIHANTDFQQLIMHAAAFNSVRRVNYVARGQIEFHGLMELIGRHEEFSTLYICDTDRAIVQQSIAEALHFCLTSSGNTAATNYVADSATVIQNLFNNCYEFQQRFWTIFDLLRSYIDTLKLPHSLRAMLRNCYHSQFAPTFSNAIKTYFGAVVRFILAAWSFAGFPDLLYAATHASSENLYTAVRAMLSFVDIDTIITTATTATVTSTGTLAHFLAQGGNISAINERSTAVIERRFKSAYHLIPLGIPYVTIRNLVSLTPADTIAEIFPLTKLYCADPAMLDSLLEFAESDQSLPAANVAGYMRRFNLDLDAQNDEVAMALHHYLAHFADVSRAINDGDDSVQVKSKQFVDYTSLSIQIQAQLYSQTAAPLELNSWSAIHAYLRGLRDDNARTTNHLDDFRTMMRTWSDPILVGTQSVDNTDIDFCFWLTVAVFVDMDPFIVDPARSLNRLCNLADKFTGLPDTASREREYGNLVLDYVLDLAAAEASEGGKLLASASYTSRNKPEFVIEFAGAADNAKYVSEETLRLTAGLLAGVANFLAQLPAYGLYARSISAQAMTVALLISDDDDSMVQRMAKYRISQKSGLPVYDEPAPIGTLFASSAFLHLHEIYTRDIVRYILRLCGLHFREFSEVSIDHMMTLDRASMILIDRLSSMNIQFNSERVNTVIKELSAIYIGSLTHALLRIAEENGISLSDCSNYVISEIALKLAAMTGRTPVLSASDEVIVKINEMREIVKHATDVPFTHALLLFMENVRISTACVGIIKNGQFISDHEMNSRKFIESGLLKTVEEDVPSTDEDRAEFRIVARTAFHATVSMLLSSGQSLLSAAQMVTAGNTINYLSEQNSPFHIATRVDSFGISDIFSLSSLENHLKNLSSNGVYTTIYNYRFAPALALAARESTPSKANEVLRQAESMQPATDTRTLRALSRMALTDATWHIPKNIDFLKTWFTGVATNDDIFTKNRNKLISTFEMLQAFCFHTADMIPGSYISDLLVDPMRTSLAMLPGGTDNRTVNPHITRWFRCEMCYGHFGVENCGNFTETSALRCHQCGEKFPYHDTHRDLTFVPRNTTNAADDVPAFGPRLTHPRNITTFHFFERSNIEGFAKPAHQYASQISPAVELRRKHRAYAQEHLPYMVTYWLTRAVLAISVHGYLLTVNDDDFTPDMIENLDGTSGMQEVYVKTARDELHTMTPEQLRTCWQEHAWSAAANFIEACSRKSLDPLSVGAAAFVQLMNLKTQELIVPETENWDHYKSFLSAAQLRRREAESRIWNMVMNNAVPPYDSSLDAITEIFKRHVSTNTSTGGAANASTSEARLNVGAHYDTSDVNNLRASITRNDISDTVAPLYEVYELADIVGVPRAVLAIRDTTDKPLTSETATYMLRPSLLRSLSSAALPADRSLESPLVMAIDSVVPKMAIDAAKKLIPGMRATPGTVANLLTVWPDIKHILAVAPQICQFCAELARAHAEVAPDSTDTVRDFIDQSMQNVDLRPVQRAIDLMSAKTFGIGCQDNIRVPAFDELLENPLAIVGSDLLTSLMLGLCETHNAVIGTIYSGVDAPLDQDPIRDSMSTIAIVHAENMPVITLRPLTAPLARIISRVNLASKQMISGSDYEAIAKKFRGWYTLPVNQSRVDSRFLPLTRHAPTKILSSVGAAAYRPWGDIKAMASIFNNTTLTKLDFLTEDTGAAAGAAVEHEVPNNDAISAAAEVISNIVAERTDLSMPRDFTTEQYTRHNVADLTVAIRILRSLAENITALTPAGEAIDTIVFASLICLHSEIEKVAVESLPEMPSAEEFVEALLQPDPSLPNVAMRYACLPYLAPLFENTHRKVPESFITMCIGEGVWIRLLEQLKEHIDADVAEMEDEDDREFVQSLSTEQVMARMVAYFAQGLVY